MRLASQQLEDGRFPRPVRAQDGRVRPFLKHERQVFKHARVAPVHCGMLDVEDGKSHADAGR
jgi:hypothetical protein